MLMPDCRQLLSGTSTMSRLEPSGTAGMARYLVRGLFVSPPARMTARTVRLISSLINGRMRLQRQRGVRRQGGEPVGRQRAGAGNNRAGRRRFFDAPLAFDEAGDTGGCCGSLREEPRRRCGFPCWRQLWRPEAAAGGKLSGAGASARRGRRSANSRWLLPPGRHLGLRSNSRLHCLQAWRWQEQATPPQWVPAATGGARTSRSITPLAGAHSYTQLTWGVCWWAACAEGTTRLARGLCCWSPPLLSLGRGACATHSL